MSPEQKRKRTLPDSADSPVDSVPGPDSFTKSTDIYFEDGNIAVVAGNVVFRVHKSQLALHSEVFKDMLSLVTEPKDGELYEGCPVVRLTDDSKDLAVLFKVMYGQIQFDPEVVDQLISATRLATKYLMDHIRISAVRVLAISYPPSLERWDSYKGFRHRCGDILQLAAAANADILLPAAYYAMSIESVSEIFSHDLPRTVLQNCFLGKEQLSAKLAWFIWDNLGSRPECDDCTGDNCLTLLQAFHLSTNSLVTTHLLDISHDPLLGLMELMELVCSIPLCHPCRDELQQDIVKRRNSIWHDLPTTFGLGSWSELSKTHKTS